VVALLLRGQDSSLEIPLGSYYPNAITHSVHTMAIASCMSRQFTVLILIQQLMYSIRLATSKETPQVARRPYRRRSRLSSQVILTRLAVTSAFVRLPLPLFLRPPPHLVLLLSSKLPISSIPF
jgi:hypothetical protein